ncbi:cupin domain-containing protein [Pedobacter sp. Leaf194]|uniref:cupin domain-containing protein n=1 Tax=Pedobacter sp. Leaf194 TaxID=1736297 RepID=UPI00070331C4|nr:cupin domain-containing protein [Pedobacter sp. Leaf194]KQS41895.1 cupin [Pedobacter sp. Leaf194]RYD69392.1 MAG: cupin domain-containing protein [Sphingobacteriales bacterium]
MNFKDLTNKTLIADNDLPWEDLGAGVKRKVMPFDDNLMLVKVAFEKDAVGAIHNHPHLQVSYVAKGSFEVSMGNEKRVLNEGDVFFAPSNVFHGVVCLQEGLLIDIFNPHREDFL